MKFLTTAITLLLLQVSSSAHLKRDKPHGPPPKPTTQELTSAFTTADTDGNGSLSKDEALAFFLGNKPADAPAPTT